MVRVMSTTTTSGTRHVTTRTWNPCASRAIESESRRAGAADLTAPLRWRKSYTVAVGADLFHKDVPDEYIARVFAVMALAPQHTFQVLTKRHGRMRSLLSSVRWEDMLIGTGMWPIDYDPAAPLPNVWLGVSVEDQKTADLRIPALLDTPAAVRWLSCEPLLGPVDLRGLMQCFHCKTTHRFGTCGIYGRPLPYGVLSKRHIDWIVVGGESGPRARPMHPDWARLLRDQCEVAGVPFLFKQWGEWAPDECVDSDGARHVGRKPEANDPKSLVMHPAGMTALTPTNPFDPWERGHPNWHTVMRRVGKHVAGRELDGRTHDEYPIGGDE